MKKINLWFYGGLGYLALWFIPSVLSVGTVPELVGPYPAWLPIATLIIMAIPFGIGYKAGQHDTKQH